MHEWPHHRSLDQMYRSSGWFTAWDGFNVLSPQSPASDRALQIIGFLGAINFAAGLLLLGRNHAVGWLTVMPVLALSLPVVAIPFAGVLFQNGGIAGIIAFHRMLFAIPPGLALVCIGQGMGSRQASSLSVSHSFSPIFQHGVFGIMVLALLAFTTIPASGPFYNKAWHALVESPEDLAMRGVWTDCNHYARSPFYRANASFAATSGISIVMYVQNPAAVTYSNRTFYYSDGRSPSSDLESIRAVLGSQGPSGQVIVVPSTNMIYTPYSLAALCSHHWLPQEAAMAFTGANELRAMSSSTGLRPANPADPINYYQGGK